MGAAKHDAVMLERSPDKTEVAGSIPASATNYEAYTRRLQNAEEKLAPNLDGDRTHRLHHSEAAALREELIRLRRIEQDVNSAHTAEFLQAVQLEAAHQRQRWAADHDEGKSYEDWIFLVGHLTGKAAQAGKTAEMFQEHSDYACTKKMADKQLHHIITAAAVLLNWHAGLTGNDTRMRPGIGDPAS